MCGVIGYVGNSASPEFFYKGLKRLEYRGYDSAGIAMLSNAEIFIQRAEGKLVQLEKKLSLLPSSCTLGIGHTRWATHGKPVEKNAHPHRSGNMVLLHNGIIENYSPLKKQLSDLGYNFESETDTEVAAHLLNFEYSKLNKVTNNTERVKTAIIQVVSQIRGTFAFGIICSDVPDTLFVVKYGSPIVLGIGENENYMASGINALVDHTKSVIIMEDREIALLKSNEIEILDFDGKILKKDVTKVTWSQEMLEKNGFNHFMLKEIHEEPQAIAQTLTGVIDRKNSHILLQNYGLHNIQLERVQRIQVIACGSSFYAAKLASYFMEKFTKIPVEVELASEYRYKISTSNNTTLAIAVSQSGETIDTLQAIKYAKENMAQTLAIVNVPGSSIGYYCDDETLIHAGPEVGVASTKAFVAQITSLLVLGLGIAQEKKLISDKEILTNIDEIVKIPNYLEGILKSSENIKKISKHFLECKSVLFIGRGPQWPVAQEGALKLKEISYIHAEAFAAGELKHGPIALIDESMFVVCLAPKDFYYEKTISNIEEIKARGGRIFAIGTEEDSELTKISDHFVSIPNCAEIIHPFLTTACLHLFAYWTALQKGCDVDQPRNLAKSVTVE
jgi:glucosamine--fructose-6-phosphate aminotransferase (isomerizing)